MTARLLAPLLAVVLLAGCSSGTDATVQPTPQATAASPTAVATSAAPAPSPSPTATVVEVTYASGEVTGVDQRVSVQRGEKVVLRFTSDVVEEIHVHGYDLYADLAPGVPAEIAFTANLAGSWEVELHEAGRPLFQLRVA